MSRPRPSGTSQPPSKRAKLSQDPPKSSLEAVVNGSLGKKHQFSAKTNGVHSTRKDRADESRAVAVAGDGSRHGDVAMNDAGREEIVISTDEEQSSSDDDDEEDVEAEETAKASAQDEVDNQHQVVPATYDLETAGLESASQPTFGELLQAHAPDVIDVQAAYSDTHSKYNTIAARPANQRLSAPSATSLGTVLAQALKTNDRDMLQSCFSVHDLDSVRTTIERLPSQLVAKLLQKLAERLHKRPGQAGNLMVWVQWSIVTHGAYLAGQADVVKQLTELNRVLKQRASGLQPLLSLKGRLDMLQAQVKLREDIQKRAAIEDEDDEPVIYVESLDKGPEKQSTRRKELSIQKGDDAASSSSGDEMPTTMNGISDDEESEAGSEDSEDLIDDEAEETDNDSGDDLAGEELESDLDLSDEEEIAESEEESTSPKPLRRN